MLDSSTVKTLASPKPPPLPQKCTNKQVKYQEIIHQRFLSENRTTNEHFYREFLEPEKNILVASHFPYSQNLSHYDFSSSINQSNWSN